MVLVQYSLIDAENLEHEFDSVADAVAWLNGVGFDMFIAVTLTDAFGNFVDGFDGIMTAYKDNSDLWAGSQACLHLNIRQPSGGGVQCRDCGAWFCY